MKKSKDKIIILFTVGCCWNKLPFVWYKTFCDICEIIKLYIWIQSVIFLHLVHYFSFCSCCCLFFDFIVRPNQKLAEFLCWNMTKVGYNNTFAPCASTVQSQFKSTTQMNINERHKENPETWVWSGLLLVETKRRQETRACAAPANGSFGLYSRVMWLAGCVILLQMVTQPSRNQMKIKII